MNDLTFGRAFVLQRDRDISDVSGTGIIADGVVFPDGHAAIHWRGKWPLTTPHPDGLESILAIHDHGGRGDLHVIWPQQSTKGREILAAAVGRAYALAGRWEAAHGASSFLVKAAGAELRDELDDAVACEDCLAGAHGPNHHRLPAAECSAQHHGLDDGRQCIRAAQHRGDHIDERGYHWSDTVAVYPVDDSGEKTRASATEATLAAQEADSSQRSRGQRLLDAFLHRGPGYEVGANDRQACPYCPGAPMIPRHLLRMHVETRHASVLDALASGVSLDEVLHNAEAGCRLPHEMEV